MHSKQQNNKHYCVRMWEQMKLVNLISTSGLSWTQ